MDKSEQVHLRNSGLVVKHLRQIITNLRILFESAVATSLPELTSTFVDRVGMWVSNPRSPCYGGRWIHHQS